MQARLRNCALGLGFNPCVFTKSKGEAEKENVHCSRWAGLRDAAKTQKKHLLSESPQSGKSFLPRVGRDRQELCPQGFCWQKMPTLWAKAKCEETKRILTPAPTSHKNSHI